MAAKETWIKSILAGLFIGVGGIANLSVDNKALGATLFSVGLFTICTLGYHLYTGKLCYVLDSEKKGAYLLYLVQVWLGNLIGTAIAGYSMRMTRSGAALAEKAQALCDTKLNDSPWSILILAIFCNLLIYIAVENYKNNPHQLGKYIGIVIGVVVFILAGFEHCIANMFYFSVANAWSLHTVFYLLIMTVGNFIGGILPEIGKKMLAK